jgi:hypothetical protein
MIASLRVKFMEHVLAADFDFSFVLAGLGEIRSQVSGVLPKAFERRIAISGLMPDLP